MFGWLVGRIVYEEYDPSLLHPTLSILMLSMVCCPSVWRYTGVVYFFGGDEGDSVVTIGGLVTNLWVEGEWGGRYLAFEGRRGQSLVLFCRHLSFIFAAMESMFILIYFIEPRVGCHLVGARR